MPTLFEKQLQIMNSKTGEPLEGCPIYLCVSDGSTHFGYTDQNGMTPLVVRSYPITVEVIAGEEALLKGESQ
jgi:hypothetical protein